MIGAEDDDSVGSWGVDLGLIVDGWACSELVSWDDLLVGVDRLPFWCDFLDSVTLGLGGFVELIALVGLLDVDRPPSAFEVHVD